jgi:hypothetical protein
MIQQHSSRPRSVRNATGFACIVAVVGCGAGTRGIVVGSPATATTGGLRPQSTRITLERKPCFGTCPVYMVSITEDGSVVFDGRAHVDSARRVTSHNDADRVASLMRLFDDSQFFTLDDKYVYGEQNCHAYASDAPIVITSITIGGRTKRVEHDQGCSGVPAQLTLLENRIDEIARVWRWTSGQPPR